MKFKMKYNITPSYLPFPTKRRSGIKIDKVKFVVAHDTGNPNSTAKGNVKYFKDSANSISASAHIFVDDKDIIECVPALLNYPEKAWHVEYQKTKDNELFGFDSNDCAMGIEYCYGDKIDSNEAYKRYIWIIAYTCFKFNLDPNKSVVGHFILDPQRKTDPQSGLHASGRSYEQLLKDIVKEYNDCLIKEEVPMTNKTWQQIKAEEALDELKSKGLIDNIEVWKAKDLTNTPTPLWLVFELINRVTKK